MYYLLLFIRIYAQYKQLRVPHTQVLNRKYVRYFQYNMVFVMIKIILYGQLHVWFFYLSNENLLNTLTTNKNMCSAFENVIKH